MSTLTLIIEKCTCGAEITIKSEHAGYYQTAFHEQHSECATKQVRHVLSFSGDEK